MVELNHQPGAKSEYGRQAAGHQQDAQIGEVGVRALSFLPALGVGILSRIRNSTKGAMMKSTSGFRASR